MKQKKLPIERWQYLVQVGLWPKKSIFDPVGWMSNFGENETKYALRLLEGFTYFSPEIMEQMFRTAFLGLSQTVITDKSDFLAAQEQWASFVDSVLIVRVTGETPNDSDSGYTYSRLARNKLGIPQEQIVNHIDALTLAAYDDPPCNIVFVDDFVGSGRQFIETWKRSYTVAEIGNVSFELIAKMEDIRSRFYYCPVICTEKGKQNIGDYCPVVKIFSAHIYDSKHSALSNNSAIWRDDMQSEGPEFIRIASARAGLPELNGEVGCWQGFEKLGLALGFNGYAPDATLPIFTTNNNNWKPLIRF